MNNIMNEGKNKENEVLPGANTPKHEEDNRGWEFTATMLHKQFGPSEFTTWFHHHPDINYHSVMHRGMWALFASLESRDVSHLDCTIESVLISRTEYNPID